MAAPTFVGVTAKVSGTGSVVPDLSTITLQADDVLILCVQSANETIAAPSGYTEVGSQANKGTGTAAAAGSVRLAVFWKRTTGTESNPTVADPGNHVIAAIAVYRGCATSGDPWDVISEAVQGTASTSVSFATGSTTTVDDVLDVWILAGAADTTGAQTTAQANANLASINERADYYTSSGVGGGFAITAATLLTAGAVGTWSATLATSTKYASQHIALKPPTGGITEADGSAAGTAASTVTGAAIWDSVSSAAGVAASVVVGAALWLSGGSAAGVGASSVVGRAIWDSGGAAAGTAATTVTGAAIWDVVGNSAGSGAASASGEDAAAGGSDAASSGTSAVSGAGAALTAGAGNSIGAGAAASVGAAIFDSLGNSAGAGIATANTSAIWDSAGSASGVGAPNSFGTAIWDSTCNAAGSGVALAVGENAAGPGEIVVYAHQIVGSILRANIATSVAGATSATSTLDIEKTE